MRRFTKFTLFLAMLMMLSSNAYADPEISGSDSCIKVGSNNNINDGDTGNAFGNNNYIECINGNGFGSVNTLKVGKYNSAFGSENHVEGTSDGTSDDYGYNSAFGFNNHIQSNYSVAVGLGNGKTPGEDGDGNPDFDNMAGYTPAGTFGDFSSAIGVLNNAGGTYASAFGFYNIASSLGSAFGYKNRAFGESSSAFGNSNYVEGESGSAFGNSNQANGIDSSAFGYSNQTSGANSNAFGFCNRAEGDWSSAYGYKNHASGNLSSAVGNGNFATGGSSGAFGYSNRADGQFSNAFGMGNQAAGQYSSALGYSNAATSNGSVAVGNKNNWDESDPTDPKPIANGVNSTAVGVGNIASGNKSSAFGFESWAKEANSTALGYQAVAGEAGTVSFGHSSTDTNFSGVAYGSDLEAKLVHVASGTALTDAVNYGQMQKYVAENAGGSLTPEQTLAVNSGITVDKVASYDNFISNIHYATSGAFRISNVANAENDDDAVNYGQVKDAYVGASFDSTSRKLTLTKVNGETMDVEIPAGSGSGTDPELSAKVTKNTTDIATNKADIAANKTDIATNKTNIAKNASEIENIKKTQEGLGVISSKTNDNKFSDGSIAIGAKNESGKSDKVSMAIGSDNVVVGKNSIAIGYSINGKHNDVVGNYSIAVGYGNKITGNNSGAFGDPSDISGHGSYAMGNDNKITGNGSFIVGNNGNVSGANSVAIGNQSVATADNVVSFGHSAGDEKGQEGGTYEEDLNRRLIHVADAQDDNDAVNYGQMKDYVAANGGNSGEVIKLRSDLNKMDGRISKVGASAGALAALKPMEFDPDNKWSAGVGFGNLNGRNAAAVGLFYRPSRDVYYSVGGNVGGEENIVNAGINFSFGHRTEKPAVKPYGMMCSAVPSVDTDLESFCQENADLRDKVAAQDAEIISQKGQINSQKEEISELKTKNSDLEYRIKHLERLMLKMVKEQK